MATSNTVLTTLTGSDGLAVFNKIKKIKPPKVNNKKSEKRIADLINSGFFK